MKNLSQEFMLYRQTNLWEWVGMDPPVPASIWIHPQPFSQIGLAIEHKLLWQIQSYCAGMGLKSCPHVDLYSSLQGSVFETVS